MPTIDGELTGVQVDALFGLGERAREWLAKVPQRVTLAETADCLLAHGAAWVTDFQSEPVRVGPKADDRDAFFAARRLENEQIARRKIAGDELESDERAAILARWNGHPVRAARLTAQTRLARARLVGRRALHLRSAPRRREHRATRSHSRASTSASRGDPPGESEPPSERGRR